MTEAENTTWTPEQQIENYNRARAIVNRLCVGRPSEWREEVASAAFTRWLAESHSASVAQYVTWAIAEASEDAQQEQPAKEELSSSDLDVMDVDAQETTMARIIDAQREMDARSAPAVTVSLNLLLKDFRQIQQAELEPGALQDALESLATRYELGAKRHPRDERCRQVASVLRALACRQYDPAEISGKTDYWRDANHMGLWSRAKQADELMRVVGREDAREVVHRLGMLHLLTVDTTARLWPEADRDAAIKLVQSALTATKGQPLDLVAKAVLQALGAPPVAVKNLASHRAKAKTRARAKGNRSG